MNRYLCFYTFYDTDTLYHCVVYDVNDKEDACRALENYFFENYGDSLGTFEAVLISECLEPDELHINGSYFI